MTWAGIVDSRDPETLAYEATDMLVYALDYERWVRE